MLTAEGRLSAWVLAAPPIAIGLYMFAVNPDYIGVLFTTCIGLFMLGALVLLVLDPLDEKDRGYRCLRSGWFSLSHPPSSPSC